MFTNTMLPASSTAGPTPQSEVLRFRSSPGLTPAAIGGLRAKFPGNLTPEFEKFLGTACGLDGTPLQYIDFTGQWHDEEPLAVFRPSLTLAIDGQGRRWIAETHKTAGLPGPVWCVHERPQVVVYVAADVGALVDLLQTHSTAGATTSWLKSVDAAANNAWNHRGALAFHARQEGPQDTQVRQWLLHLPRDARVFDLRCPKFGTAWPYGVAGTAGRFHRCGREMLFAVSGFPAPTRWADYLGNLAWQQDIPVPAAIADQHAPPRQAIRASPATLPAHQHPSSCNTRLVLQQFAPHSSRCNLVCETYQR